MTRPNVRTRWLSTAFAAFVAFQASAQVRIQVQGGGLDGGKPEPAPSYPSDQAVVRTLDEAKKRRGERAFAPASVALQIIFSRSEETWIQLPDKNWRSATSIAEKMLLDEPALLADYRSQFEHEAAAEFKEAGDDTSRLASVMKKFFLTRPGAEAAERLATMLLDAGKPNLAAVYFERVLECSAHESFQTPSLKLKFAVAQKLAAASEKKVAAETKSVAGRKPEAGDATVLFGGKPTKFAELLDQMEWPKEIVAELLPDWPLPTGNASRAAQTSGGLPLLGAEQTASSRPISDNKKLIGQFDRVAERNRHRGRSTFLGAQPIIVGDAACARTCRGVEAIDLRTGKALWPTSYVEGDPIDKQEFVFDEWEDSGRAFNASAIDSFILGNTLYGSLSSDGKRVYLIDELYVQPGTYNLFMIGRDKGDATRRTCNRLTALDVATGKPLWRFGGSEARKNNDPNGQIFFFGPPTPYGGKLYVIAELQSEVGLWELDPESGKPTWKQRLLLMHRRIDADPFRRSQSCTVVASEGIAVCPTNTSRLFAVDLVSKTVLWERNFDGDLTQRTNLNFNFIDVAPPPDNPHLADPPIIVGGKVVFQGPNLQGVHCLELRNGQTSWRKERSGDQHVAGVLQGKVLLVGGGRVRAIGLDDGDEAWLTATPTPSGRGVFAHGKYLLPTERGDCLAIDVATGKTMGTSLSIDLPARALGNLAARSDALVSLGRSGLRVFPLVELIRREAEIALNGNVANPRGLYFSGLIALHEQKLEVAAGKLLASLQSGEEFPERTQASRTLLRLALEDSLGDFPAIDALLGELRKVAKEPRDQAVVFRLAARAHLKAGRWSEALQAAEDQASFPELGLIQTLTDSSARDPWLWAKSFATQVFKAAPPEKHRELIGNIERWHATAAENGDLDKLRHVAIMYDGLAISRRARLAIGRLQLARRRLDLASLAFTAALRGATHEDDKAKALSGLSTVADSGRLPIDAYWFLERWKKEAPGGRDADGRTAAQAIAEFLKENGSTVPAPPERKRWIIDGTHSKLETTVDRRSFGGRNWIKPIGSESPYFQNRAFSFKRGESAFVSMNLESARVEHETVLGEETIRSTVDTVQGTAPVVGYIYFAALDDKVAAMSVLDRGSLLWFSAPGLPDSFKEELDVVAEWSQFEGKRALDAVQVGPVGPDFVVVRSPKELFAVDPATGKPLWRRSDLGAGRRMFGDAEHLYIVGGKGDYIAVRPSDGEKIAEGRWSWFSDGYTEQLCKGRFILRTSARGSANLEIRLWDPVSDKDVWKRTFPKGSRRWAVSASEPIAVATPEGKVDVLDDATGETLSNFSLEKPLPRGGTIRAFRQGESLFASVEENGSKVTERGAVGGVESRMINGRLLALDRGGSKPLWDASIKNSRLLAWPLDLLPVVATIEMPEGRRTTEATTTFRAFEKTSGRKLVETSLPSEMQTINDVAIEGRRSRIELSGWTKKLQLWFGEAPKPPNKKPDGPTIEDVGNLAGKFFNRINSDKSAPPKTKK